jgi:hypothetical protein
VAGKGLGGIAAAITTVIVLATARGRRVRHTRGQLVLRRQLPELLRDESEGAVTYWCKLDGESLQVCDSSGRSFSNLAPGQHRFTVQALDSLGLVGPQTSYDWTIDVSPPDTSITSHPDETVTGDSARFTFSSTGGGAGFLCRLDSAGYRSCSSPKTLRSLGDGRHVFNVAAIDRAGNRDPNPASFAFYVRTVPSAPVITSGPAPGSLAGPRPSFGFGARYAARFQCRFDGHAFEPCSGARSHSPRSPLTNGRTPSRFVGSAAPGSPGPRRRAASPSTPHHRPCASGSVHASMLIAGPRWSSSG